MEQFDGSPLIDLQLFLSDLRGDDAPAVRHAHAKQNALNGASELADLGQDFAFRQPRG